MNKKKINLNEKIKYLKADIKDKRARKRIDRATKKLAKNIGYDKKPIKTTIKNGAKKLVTKPIEAAQVGAKIIEISMIAK